MNGTTLFKEKGWEYNVFSFKMIDKALEMNNCAKQHADTWNTDTQSSLRLLTAKLSEEN